MKKDFKTTILYLFVLLVNSFCKNIDKQKEVKHSNDTPMTNSENLKRDSLNDFKYPITNDSVNEDSILNKLYSLKKLKKVSKICKFSVLVKGATDSGDDFEFDVGINREERFQTMYIFIYKKKSNAILYYDTFKDVYIDVNKWDKDKSDAHLDNQKFE